MSFSSSSLDKAPTSLVIARSRHTSALQASISLLVEALNSGEQKTIISRLPVTTAMGLMGTTADTRQRPRVVSQAS